MHDDFLTSAWADHHQHIGSSFDKVTAMFSTAVTRVAARNTPLRTETCSEKVPDVEAATV